MTDADGEGSTDVRLDVRENGQEYVLSVVPDAEWLSAPGRAYPVKIDPNFKLNDKKFSYGVIESNQPDKDHSGNPYLFVGYETYLVGVEGVDYDHTKSYVKFSYDFKKKLGSAAIINKAKLHAHKYADETPASGSRVYSEFIEEGWKGNGDHTWGNQPSTKRIENGVDVSGHVDGWCEWDITNAVTAWAIGQPNHGLMLAPKDSSQKAVAFSASGNAHDSTNMYIELAWKIPYQVDDDLALDAPEILLHPLTGNTGDKQALSGVLADGLVRPNLDVDYRLLDGAIAVDSGTYEEAEPSMVYPDSSVVKNVSFDNGKKIP